MAAVLGFMALAAPLAHAGGGAGGGGTFFIGFQCYVIDGVYQKRTVSLFDQFGERTDVQLGNGRLLCTPVEGEVTEGDLDEVSGFPDHLKCYSISSRTRFDPRVPATLTDAFDVETVEVRDPRLLCIPVVKEVNGGVD
jgi:hypothetical protein